MIDNKKRRARIEEMRLDYQYIKDTIKNTPPGISTHSLQSSLASLGRDIEKATKRLKACEKTERLVQGGSR